MEIILHKGFILNVVVNERKYYHRSNVVVITHVLRYEYSPGETCAVAASFYWWFVPKIKIVTIQ